MKTSEIATQLEAKYPGEPEFTQVVREVLLSIKDIYNQHPEFEKNKIVERLVEPDHIFTLRIPQVDDKGEVQINLGYRVQFNNAIGPYKGGTRFYHTVNLSTLKLLGFEQTFKNALSTLPMGGSKGGSDFSPKGKSEREIMRFCRAYVTELYKYIGPDMDVPAGDVNVGGRGVGFMYGMYKKLTRECTSTFTGKGFEFGGLHLRPESTGYGAIYMVNDICKQHDIGFRGKTVTVSGFGNVAWGATMKATELGAKVVYVSGPDGYIYDENDINTQEKFDYICELRNSGNDVVEPYTKEFGAQFFAGKKPWEHKVDIVLPCAIQNELNLEDAKKPITNGVTIVAEVSNMGCIAEAAEFFVEKRIIFAPSKVVNYGGVSCSCLEMSQNVAHTYWSEAEVGERLHQIMKDAHAQCVECSKEPDSYINYVKSISIAGFTKVAKVMIGQGVC